MNGECGNHQSGADAPLDFLAWFATSRQFDEVFSTGMALVEETANYLDGPGRRDIRALGRHAAVDYATQSMHLTTLLMQLTSWLLLQRAMIAGEITPDAARTERQRITLDKVYFAEAGAIDSIAGEDRLPDGLRALIARAACFHRRIIRLDAIIAERNTVAVPGINPVTSQIDQLRAAFAKG